MAWKLSPEEIRYRTVIVPERDRLYRWAAPCKARIEHPAYGVIVVPHRSNYAAMECAAEAWGCDPAELLDCGVWLAEPGAVAAEMPDAARRYRMAKDRGARHGEASHA